MNTLVSPDPATTAEPPRDNVWAAFGLRGLRNLLLCLLIALLLWSVGPGGLNSFFVDLAYSVPIGSLCWLFIDGSRLLLAHWRYRRAPQAWQRGARWPGAPLMLVCILVGTVLGYSAGAQIGDLLTGHHLPSMLQNRAAVLISLIAALAATSYFYAIERVRDERTAAEAAQRLATESQLKLLESQLEPHMLFNTLANLRVLIAVDAARAQAMLDHLIAYLRATLRASRVGRHALAAEFERLADYLALMSVRMGPRLAVQFDLPEALRAQPVPALLLQPLVENAIQHGLEPKLEGGRIQVRASTDGDMLVLEVRDTGIGLGSTPRAGGYGLTHVRERLAVLYGGRASCVLAPAGDDQGGTRVELRLPLDADAPAADPKAAA